MSESFLNAIPSFSDVFLRFDFLLIVESQERVDEKKPFIFQTNYEIEKIFVDFSMISYNVSMHECTSNAKNREKVPKKIAPDNLL